MIKGWGTRRDGDKRAGHGENDDKLLQDEVAKKFIRRLGQPNKISPGDGDRPI